MKTFDFIQPAISRHVKDPHSKALEPDCLSPPLAIMTQSLRGEGCDEGWLRTFEFQTFDSISTLEFRASYSFLNFHYYNSSLSSKGKDFIQILWIGSGLFVRKERMEGKPR